LEYLAELVACDTQNPPRKIASRGWLFELLGSACSRDFEIQVSDFGDGRVAWYARRGMPRTLFNVHLDTVPAGSQWESDPFQLQVTADRAIGLGTCDIKGAAACLLALAKESDVELGLLFTTDEEGSNSCCVRRFIESVEVPPKCVVVAEPTRGNAVLGHRGYLSRRGTFRGRAGHTSLPKNSRRSAIHELIQWSAAALQFVSTAEDAAGPGVDFCFNLGTISGGTKNNMIADQADVRWSANPSRPRCRVCSRRSRISPRGRKLIGRRHFSGRVCPALFSCVKRLNNGWRTCR
jgi:acetylornithine deacetylase